MTLQKDYKADADLPTDVTGKVSWGDGSSLMVDSMIMNGSSISKKYTQPGYYNISMDLHNLVSSISFTWNVSSNIGHHLVK